MAITMISWFLSIQVPDADGGVAAFRRYFTASTGYGCVDVRLSAGGQTHCKCIFCDSMVDALDGKA